MAGAGKTKTAMLQHLMMVCASVIFHFMGTHVRTFLALVVWKKGRIVMASPSLAMVAESVIFKRACATANTAFLVQLVRQSALASVEGMVNAFQIWLVQLFVIASPVGVVLAARYMKAAQRTAQAMEHAVEAIALVTLGSLGKTALSMSVLTKTVRKTEFAVMASATVTQGGKDWNAKNVLLAL